MVEGGRVQSLRRLSWRQHSPMARSMKTSQDRASGGYDEPAMALTKLLLDARAVLPHGLNGSPPAPSDPRAANIRREMQQGRSSEFKRLLTAMTCDLRDGVPFALVVAPLRQMIATLEIAAVDGLRQRADRPVLTLIRRETRAQARSDLAQFKVAESPTSTSALADVVREASAHLVTLTDLIDGCERELAMARTVAQ